MNVDEIRILLEDGRRNEAVKAIANALRTGQADSAMQLMAAGLLDPPKRLPGRPRSAPKLWRQIAAFIAEKDAAGVSRGDAVRLADKRFGYSEPHIRRCIAFARDGLL